MVSEGIHLPPSHKFDVVLVGGSAGSFPIVSKMLEKLPASFPLPVVMCLHRLKDTEGLNAETGWAVWQGFLQGRIHWSRVWALVVLQLWHEQYR